MRYRFIIEVQPEDLPQEELIEAFYLELRKGREGWDILGNPGFFNRKGHWVKGGYAISGDLDHEDQYAIIKLGDEAVGQAKERAAASYASNPLNDTPVHWPEMTLTAFALGRADKKVKKSL
jgi:hypothetical protein